MTPRILILVLALIWAADRQSSRAQGTAFTYQGRLGNNGGPANGNYDLEFTIYDSSAGGLVIGSAVTNNPTAVSNGLFIVTLDPGFGVFTGPPRWLEIGVRTNGDTNAYQILSPRQELTASPYAITAASVSGVVPASGLSGTYPGAVTLNNPANVFAGNGTALTLNAGQLTNGILPPSALANAWQIGGNIGTSPVNNNYIGTADNQPLELRVNQSRAYRWEPGTNVASVVGAPNVVGGAPVNVVDGGIYGATIAGGGALNMTGFMPGLSSNHISAIFGSIGGGRLNTVGADHGTIAGGLYNSIQGFAYDSVIAGGYGHSIGSNSVGAAIGGGHNNTIGMNSYESTVSGGYLNTITSSYSSVGGGFFNSIQGYYDSIGGGYENYIYTNAYYNAIGGGIENTIQSNSSYAVIPGGYLNTAAGNYSFAAGNQAQALHTGAFVWADATGSPFASTSANQFLVRANGGVGINTNNPGSAALNVAGTVQATSFQGDGSGLTNLNLGALGNYVFAYNNGTQNVVAANTYQDITFPADSQISGWVHTAGASQYTNTQPGIYLIQFSAYAENVSGSNVQMRATLNGSEIPGSRTIATFPALNQIIPLSRSLLTSANAGDVLTIQFTGSATGIRLFGTANSALAITRIQ